MPNYDGRGPASGGAGRGRGGCYVSCGHQQMPMACCGMGRWSKEDRKTWLEQGIKMLESELVSAKEELGQLEKDKS